jgi:FAD synthase
MLANLSDDHVQDYLTETGIYYGYAKVCDGNDSVEEMVMSVGYNPFYNNKVRSAVIRTTSSLMSRKFTSCVTTITIFTVRK